MNIQELINALQAAQQNSQAEVEFLAMFEQGVWSGKDDQTKEIQLRFNDCDISSNHPNKVQITLS